MVPIAMINVTSVSHTISVKTDIVTGSFICKTLFFVLFVINKTSVKHYFLSFLS